MGHVSNDTHKTFAYYVRRLKDNYNPRQNQLVQPLHLPYSFGLLSEISKFLSNIINKYSVYVYMYVYVLQLHVRVRVRVHISTIMQYLCIVHVYMYTCTCTHVHVHTYMHTYALCGYTRHLRTCRYAAILINRPSGISQAAAIAANRTQAVKFSLELVMWIDVQDIAWQRFPGSGYSSWDGQVPLPSDLMPDQKCSALNFP